MDVSEAPIVISFDYASFEDYWSSFSMPIGQIGQRVAALSAELRAEVERHVRSGYLAGLPDGPRSFAIIVRVVRGTVPAGGQAPTSTSQQAEAAQAGVPAADHAQSLDNGRRAGFGETPSSRARARERLPLPPPHRQARQTPRYASYERPEPLTRTATW